MSGDSPISLGTSHPYLDRARWVIELELAEAGRLVSRLDGSFVAAIDLLRSAVDAQRKIIVAGVGKSGHIGEKIAATLTSTGAPAIFLNSLNAMHGDLGIVGPGDVALLLSNSGETDELTALIPPLRRLEVPVIAITGNKGSTLATHAAVHLDVSVEREACPLELAPTASTTAMLILGDAVAMVLLEVRGFGREDFARYHPGGRLGRTLLLRVRDVMRPKDQVAWVSRDATVREALLAMARSRAGMAVAAGSEGELVGIFTQGDFARCLDAHPGLLDEPLAAYLNVTPITIRETDLAVEVLRIFEQRRIDDLLVLDESGKPTGVVDSQDLARHRLV
jgi:arabinose-5-phosphate isomerase